MRVLRLLYCAEEMEEGYTIRLRRLQWLKYIELFHSLNMKIIIYYIARLKLTYPVNGRAVCSKCDEVECDTSKMY